MKTPGFESEPERHPFGGHRHQARWWMIIAYIGIGISALVLYAFGMVMMIEWMAMRFVEPTRLLH